jgi:hypothetical protein
MVDLSFPSQGHIVSSSAITSPNCHAFLNAIFKSSNPHFLPVDIFEFVMNKKQTKKSHYSLDLFAIKALAVLFLSKIISKIFSFHLQ